MNTFGAVVGFLGFVVAIYRLDLLGSSRTCKADAKEKWTYRGDNGPVYWKDRYPMCAAGKEQSPIAINSKQLVYDENLSKLKMVNYEKPVTKADIVNSGKTVQITPTDGVARTIDVNGTIYKLAQLGFHWGEASNKGSEHIIDGKQYSMELQFVHLNSKDQIAVVAVMFQERKVSTIKTQELQKITESFPQVMYKNMKSKLKSGNDTGGLFSFSPNAVLNLDKLLPANPSSYFRYQGSLTFPPCTEGVIWNVLTKPLPVGTSQMKEFRKLYSATKEDASDECRISGNHRPIQPINQRKVYKSQ